MIRPQEKRFADDFRNRPETGTGYWIATAHQKDGRVFRQGLIDSGIGNQSAWSSGDRSDARSALWQYLPVLGNEPPRVDLTGLPIDLWPTVEAPPSVDRIVSAHNRGDERGIAMIVTPLRHGGTRRPAGVRRTAREIGACRADHEVSIHASKHRRIHRRADRHIGLEHRVHGRHQAFGDLPQPVVGANPGAECRGRLCPRGHDRP
jgi:hypothetical protein